MATDTQRALIDAIATALQNDPRVEAAWLSGSLGRGAGDAFSDVDILVLCADGKAREVSAVFAANPPVAVVLANVLFGGYVLNFVTADWQRFDLSIAEGAQLAMHNANILTPLFNRSDREPPRKDPQHYVIAPDKLLATVKEFFRILGLTVVGMGREEYVLGLTGLDILRRMTCELMIEENRIAPADRGGALHLNLLLTPEQRAELEAMPPQAATRESILAGHQAFAAIFLPRARRLADAIGMTWPQALDDATRQHLRKHLHIEI